MSTTRRRKKIKPINPEEQPYIHPFIADCVQVQSTSDKIKNKKRWRSTGEKASANKRCNSIPDLLQVSDTVIDTNKADCREITNKMSNIHVDAASTTSTMLDEIKTRKPYGFMQSSFWVIMMVHVMVCGDL